MRVRYTPRARVDLSEILEYLDRRSPQGANNVKLAIKKTIEFIGWYPYGGRVAGVRHTRVVPVGRYPYLVYWTIEAGEVWVVHIRHAARRPWEGGN
jgi:plasmid stabilization system protein ParE